VTLLHARYKHNNNKVCVGFVVKDLGLG